MMLDRPDAARRSLTWIAPVAVQLMGHSSAAASLFWFSRELEPAQFGQLSTGLAIQGYVILLGALGLRSVLIREAARDPQSLGSWWGAQWQVTSISGLVAVLIGRIAGAWFGTADAVEATMSTWLALGAWFGVLSVAPLLDACHRQLTSIAIVAVCEIVFAAALYTGIIPQSLATVGLALAIKWMAMSLLQAIALWIVAQPATVKPRPGMTRTLLGAALPLVVATLATNLPITLQVIVARACVGAEGAAVAGLGWQFAAGFLLLGSLALRYLQPRLRDGVDLQNSANRTFLARIALALCAAWVVVVSMMSLVCVLWLPPLYRRELPSLVTLMGAAWFGAMAYLGWACLAALEQESKILIAYVGGVAVFALLIGPLTPQWGTAGAATAALAAMATTLGAMIYSVRRAIPKSD